MKHDRTVWDEVGDYLAGYVLFDDLSAAARDLVAEVDRNGYL